MSYSIVFYLEYHGTRTKNVRFLILFGICRFELFLKTIPLNQELDYDINSIVSKYFNGC